MPHDFPPRGTVRYYFRKWRNDGTWEAMNARLREAVRRKAGRNPEPSAGALDSQSVETVGPGPQRGFDAGKKVKGRKRHVFVDTTGLLPVCVVHGADVQDRDGGKRVMAKATAPFGRLRLVRADGGYAGKFPDRVVEETIWRVELILRQSKGWELLPRRWVVERTSGRLNRCRRLSKDDETTTESSEAFVQIAVTHLMLRRLG